MNKLFMSMFLLSLLSCSHLSKTFKDHTRKISSIEEETTPYSYSVSFNHQKFIKDKLSMNVMFNCTNQPSPLELTNSIRFKDRYHQFANYEDCLRAYKILGKIRSGFHEGISAQLDFTYEGTSDQIGTYYRAERIMILDDEGRVYKELPNVTMVEKFTFERLEKENLVPRMIFNCTNNEDLSNLPNSILIKGAQFKFKNLKACSSAQTLFEKLYSGHDKDFSINLKLTYEGFSQSIGDFGTINEID